MTTLFAATVAQIKAQHRAQWDGYAYSVDQSEGDEPNLPVILCTCGTPCYASQPDVDRLGESEGAEAAWGDHLVEVTAHALAATRLIARDADRASSWSDGWLAGFADATEHRRATRNPWLLEATQ